MTRKVAGSALSRAVDELARLREAARSRKRETEAMMAAKWRTTAMNDRMLILHRIDGSAVYEVAINRVHIRSITTNSDGQTLITFGGDDTDNNDMIVSESLAQVLAAMGEDMQKSLSLQEQNYLEYGVAGSRDNPQ